MGFFFGNFGLYAWFFIYFDSVKNELVARSFITFIIVVLLVVCCRLMVLYKKVVRLVRRLNFNERKSEDTHDPLS